MYNFVIGNVYTFSTRAPSLLGAIFEKVTILGIVDYNIAVSFLNVDLYHRRIYPLLPQGTIDNPKKFTYILVKTESGEQTVLAYEWIDDTSIELIDAVTLSVLIPNVNLADSGKIRDALSLLGFLNFTISVDTSGSGEIAPP